jgi:hypothetical protein
VNETPKRRTVKPQNPAREALLVVGGSLGGLLAIVLVFLVVRGITREKTPVADVQTAPVLVKPTEAPAPIVVVQEPAQVVPTPAARPAAPAPVTPVPVGPVEEAPSRDEEISRALRAKLFDCHLTRIGVPRGAPLVNGLDVTIAEIVREHEANLIAAWSRMDRIAAAMAPQGKEEIY